MKPALSTFCSELCWDVLSRDFAMVVGEVDWIDVTVV